MQTAVHDPGGLLEVGRNYTVDTLSPRSKEWSRNRTVFERIGVSRDALKIMDTYHSM